MRMRQFPADERTDDQEDDGRDARGQQFQKDLPHEVDHRIGGVVDFLHHFPAPRLHMMTDIQLQRAFVVHLSCLRQQIMLDGPLHVEHCRAYDVEDQKDPQPDAKEQEERNLFTFQHCQEHPVDGVPRIQRLTDPYERHDESRREEERHIPHVSPHGPPKNCEEGAHERRGYSATIRS
jgi:hypothetical protein